MTHTKKKTIREKFWQRTFNSFIRDLEIMIRVIHVDPGNFRSWVKWGQKVIWSVRDPNYEFYETYSYKISRFWFDVVRKSRTLEAPWLWNTVGMTNFLIYKLNSQFNFNENHMKIYDDTISRLWILKGNFGTYSKFDRVVLLNTISEMIKVGEIQWF